MGARNSPRRRWLDSQRFPILRATSQMRPESNRAGRPFGVTAMSTFFMFGTLMSLLAATSLAFPGSILEPLWRLNPGARQEFAGIGLWGVGMMLAVCAATAFTSLGLWRGRMWGHRLGLLVLAINVVADIARAAFGHDPRAGIGVPIAGGMMAYLMSGQVTRYFLEKRPLRTDDFVASSVQ